MKKTLLEITQFLLSSLDSDEVNSITDTSEAMQVAMLIKGVYEDLIIDLDLPEHRRMFQMNATTDINQPTIMTIPEEIDKVYWIKYDVKDANETKPRYADIVHVPWEDFIQRQNGLYSDANSSYFTYDSGGDTITVYYSNDRAPRICSSPDDYALFFDSYDSSVDSTLQKSKTQCFGRETPLFPLEDDFIPDLDRINYSLFINTAKARAFAEIKQTANDEAASQARIQKLRSQKNRNRDQEGFRERYAKLPDFSRRTGTTRITTVSRNSW